MSLRRLVQEDVVGADSACVREGRGRAEGVMGHEGLFVHRGGYDVNG